MTDLSVAPPIKASLSPLAKGVLFGIAAVLIWGSYLALARKGVSAGLTGVDFALIRYGTAGLVMLPWMIRHSIVTLGGVGWPRGLALALFAGPAFILFAVGGYAFAPLAHGAVFQPASVIIVTTALAAFVLKDRPPMERVVGIGIMVIGLAVISGPALFAGSILTPVGDLMFVIAGALWAGFTILTRRWKIGAMQATGAVAVVSALAIIPYHLLTQDLSRIAALPVSSLVLQILVQGVLSGVVAVILFTRAAELIGAARSAIFPALVPAAAILIGIPVTGELPNTWQIAGLAFVSLGLFTSLGLFKRRT
jgi:drug/metabolite transporter (DMT)-like permease